MPLVRSNSGRSPAGINEKGDRAHDRPLIVQDVVRRPAAGRRRGVLLLTQTKFREDRTVALDVVHPQVVQLLLALSDQGHQRLLRRVVLLVGLQVPGQVVDALGQECDLAFSPTGVLLGTAVLRENGLFGFARQVHGHS